MKKFYSLFIMASTVFSLGHAQTTIYEMNFNSGSAPGWILNGSGNGENQWIVNGQYAGLPPVIDNTPAQPAAIAGGPNSNYLHIYNTTICALASICNATFDTGSASNRTAETPTINTTGYSGVTASFYYISAGISGSAFGSVEYSTDGGASWITALAQLTGVSNWTLGTINASALSGVVNLKLRFRWINGASGDDPAFAIDDFKVEGIVASTNSIATTNNITPTNWCLGNSQNVNVNFTATGTFNAGNVFNAERSDAAGSFASPIVIGTLTSTASGAQSISSIFAAGSPAGNGYLIRVVSTNPVTVGSVTTTGLTINQLPAVSLQTLASVCSNGQASAIVGGAPVGGTYSGVGVSGGNFSPATAGAGLHNITYTYTDGNSCPNSATQAITVNAAPNVILAPLSSVCVNLASFTLVGGTPAGGTYSGLGVTGSTFNPSAAGVGAHTIVYNFIDGNGCSGMASQVVQVDACASIYEYALDGLINVYPVPSNNIIQVASEIQIFSIELIDLTGAKLADFNANQTSFSIENYSKGTYFLKIETEKGVTIKKIVKN